MSATSSSPTRCAAPRPASAAEIVAEKEFKDTGTARRTDSGVVQIQRQMPVFMQDLPDHDVVLVADESEVFGTYVPFRTWIPRPVAGTAGLVPSAWHPASEQWGGTQIQNRFAKANGRRMLSKDMSAWTAARIVGDAATRTQGADPKKIESLHPRRRFLDRRLQGPEADLPQMELAAAAADLPRRRAARSCRPRRRRVSCTRSRSSTRWASISRRRNAS